MPRFEVVIPAVRPEQPFELRLRADGDTWMPALRLGLERICGGKLTPSVVCDVREDGYVEVSDPSTGRTFHIVELTDAAPAPPGRAAAPAAAPDRRAALRSPDEEAREELLADLFLRAPAVRERSTPGDGLGYLLDLALEKIRCAGARAFLARSDGVLAQVAGRGAGADAGRRVEIAMGAGLVGFAARYAVALCVSDARADRRWSAADAPPGHAARSVLCAPVCRGGRVFGALELLDRAGGPFDAGDRAVLDYLAHQAAGFLAELEARAPT